MKRTISLWLGLAALAIMPAIAQTPAAAPTGKIHGHVTNPTGSPSRVAPSASLEPPAPPQDQGCRHRPLTKVS